MYQRCCDADFLMDGLTALFRHFYLISTNYIVSPRCSVTLHEQTCVIHIPSQRAPQLLARARFVDHVMLTFSEETEDTVVSNSRCVLASLSSSWLSSDRCWNVRICQKVRKFENRKLKI